MAINQQSYLTLLTSLLPRGLAWLETEAANLRNLLDALAAELARIDAREDDLLDEADPRATYEMLSDWESAYGLTDGCIGSDLTVQQRLNLLLAKVTNKGGQSRQFFIDLAASLGYVITITEFSPYTVGDTVATSIYGLDWSFAWQVNAPSESVSYFTALSAVNDPLSSWGNARLECAISRLKPAHTIVLFAYGE